MRQVIFIKSSRWLFQFIYFISLTLNKKLKPGEDLKKMLQKQVEGWVWHWMVERLPSTVSYVPPLVEKKGETQKQNKFKQK